jgi:hypothetical protein
MTWRRKKPAPFRVLSAVATGLNWESIVLTQTLKAAPFHSLKSLCETLKQKEHHCISCSAA